MTDEPDGAFPAGWQLPPNASQPSLLTLSDYVCRNLMMSEAEHEWLDLLYDVGHVMIHPATIGPEPMLFIPHLLEAVAATDASDFDDIEVHAKSRTVFKTTVREGSPS